MTNADYGSWIWPAELGRGATALVGVRIRRGGPAKQAAAFARCGFDERGCSLGLRRLRAYRKGWDEGRAVWKDRPRHDEASHGADAFLTFACSGHTPPSAIPTRKRSFGWVV